MTLDDIQLFLPKYLSAGSKEELFSGLKDFPENIDSRLYTTSLYETNILYQGDGIKDFLFINLPDNTSMKLAPGIVLSNTCDLHTENLKLFQSRIIYAPILNLEKYQTNLRKQLDDKAYKVDNFIASIRKQEVTQIFYLPELPYVINESIVFLDRVLNIGNDFISREDLRERRLFTLSNYGIYLFVFKLSLHFTRLQDSVDRQSVQPT
jgi:hypothetical protein